MNQPDPLDEKFTKLRAAFFVPRNASELLASFTESTKGLHDTYASVAQAFSHNISAAISTLGIPFELAAASIQQSHFQRFYIAEKIRARSFKDFLDTSDKIENEQGELASSRAHLRMMEFLDTTEGRDKTGEGICNFLLSALDHGLKISSQELMHQGAVLLWSAIEILFRDAFEALMNNDPNLALTLVKDSRTKKRFDLEKISLSTLAAHGFDLSDCLGTLLVRQQDFSDITTIKSTFTVLFEESQALRDSLNSEELWRLCQQRHLIVHNRGTIDRAYVEKFGAPPAIGSKLQLRPLDIDNYLDAAILASKSLVDCLMLAGRSR